jgi:SAM-dependent methyltransferase
LKSECYTPGHSQNAVEFMARRTLQSHGAFFLSHLTAGLSVLDCGCGPGTITRGIAERVHPGRVVGVDAAASQVEQAAADARNANLPNVRFQAADCYELPFEDASFDRVFSHALLEHLSDPLRALRELHRVLKHDGVIGLCSPDWGGFLLAPPSSRLSDAIDAYMRLQTANGGDVHVGRKLGSYLAAACFDDVRMSARYECYDSPELIGEYLAAQLERGNDRASAQVLRDWAGRGAALFAQAWVAATARKT